MAFCRRPRAPWWRLLFVAVLVLPVLAGCGAVTGFPEDPEDEAAQIEALRPFFSPAVEKQYYALTDPALRRAKRDEIVFNRIRLLDVMFGRFERQLWGFGTSTALGSDLVALTLGGLAATTGHGPTASALAAASAGVVAGQAALSKDLFYKEALPAVLAQMEANRDAVKAEIIDALLTKSDAEYGLPQALMAVQALKSAGDVPHSLGAITKTATANKEAAQQALVTAQYQAVIQAPALVTRKARLTARVRRLAAEGRRDDLVAVAKVVGVDASAASTIAALRAGILGAVASSATDAAKLDGWLPGLAPIIGDESTW